MTGSALVVADTTPLNYLTIIGQVHVLGALFGKVLVPEGVLAELKHPSLIDIADEMGLLNGIAALNDLRNTTFRADPRLLERFEVKMCARRS